MLSNIFGSYLKDYMSERKAVSQLRKCIIKKSRSVIKSGRSNLTPITNFKKLNLNPIYKLILKNRGGQLENFRVDHEFANEMYKLALDVKTIIEQLASFLKEKELKEGIATIFFKNGRLVLDLILYGCKINLTYLLVNEGLSTKVIVVTSTIGGITGFIVSWCSVALSLAILPLFESILLIRSI